MKAEAETLPVFRPGHPRLASILKSMKKVINEPLPASCMAGRFSRGKEKNKLFSKRNLVAVFIAAIMVLSTLGFIMMNADQSSTTLEYNGHKFRVINGGYETVLDQKAVTFRYMPQETMDADFDMAAIPLLKKANGITLTYDENSTFVQQIAYDLFQLETVVSEHTSRTISKGLMSENTYEFPVITCVDSTQTQPVISVSQGDEERIIVKDSCIVVTSSSANGFTVATEWLSYVLLGIIDEQDTAAAQQTAGS
jgi:hypothetical protein